MHKLACFEVTLYPVVWRQVKIWFKALAWMLLLFNISLFHNSPCEHVSTVHAVTCFGGWAALLSAKPTQLPSVICLHYSHVNSWQVVSAKWMWNVLTYFLTNKLCVMQTGRGELGMLCLSDFSLYFKLGFHHIFCHVFEQIDFLMHIWERKRRCVEISA